MYSIVGVTYIGTGLKHVTTFVRQGLGIAKNECEVFQSGNYTTIDMVIRERKIQRNNLLSGERVLFLHTHGKLFVLVRYCERLRVYLHLRQMMCFFLGTQFHISDCLEDVRFDDRQY